MEKSWPEKKRDPRIRVSFSERLYEEQVDPFARAKSLELCRLYLAGLYRNKWTCTRAILGWQNDKQFGKSLI